MSVQMYLYVLFFIQNSIAKYPQLRLQELTLKHLQAETLSVRRYVETMPNYKLKREIFAQEEVSLISWSNPTPTLWCLAGSRILEHISLVNDESKVILKNWELCSDSYIWKKCNSHREK